MSRLIEKEHPAVVRKWLEVVIKHSEMSMLFDKASLRQQTLGFKGSHERILRYIELRDAHRKIANVIAGWAKENM